MGIVIDLKERKIMSLSPLPPPASPVSGTNVITMYLPYVHCEEFDDTEIIMNCNLDKLLTIFLV